MLEKNRPGIITLRALASTAPVVILGAVVLAIYLYPFITRDPTPILDLSKQNWKACYSLDPSGKCSQFKINVPQDVTTQKDPTFKGSITYFTQFQTPKECAEKESSCTIFMSEIGDAAEFRLNGHLLGVHGHLPPQGRYAKHYPAKIELPANSFSATGTNSLTISVYSFKNVQAGIRKGPVGIFSSDDAFTLNRAQIVQTMVIPILSAAMIFLLALAVTAFSFMRKDQDPRLKSLIRYCASISFFLFSFTELPREILPISFAGFMHYFARLLSDYCFFQMMRTSFFPTHKWLNKVSPLYFITLAAYPLIFIDQTISGTFASRGFDDAFLVTRIAVPLLFLPHILGIIGSRGIRNAVIRNLMSILFISTALFQLNDSLIFHAVIRGTYFVKAYPLFIALGMTLYLFHNKAKQLITESANAMNDYAFKKVQHDLKTPIGILFDLLPTATGSVKERTMAVRALNSIQMILDSISKKDETKSNEITSLSHLFQSLHENLKVLSEKQAVTLDMIIDPAETNTSVYAPSAKLFRSLQNLASNAIDATPPGGSVKIRYSSSLGRTVIKLSDEGSGMPPEIIRNIYQGGLTNKPLEGQGLGLTSSFEEIIKFGKFEIQPSSSGTTISITLKTVRNTSPKIQHSNPITSKKIVVLVENDLLVADFWKMKANADNIHLIHCSDSEQALLVASDLPKNTPIFVDIHLDENDSGIDLAKNLVANGFENVQFATSVNAQDIPVVPGLKSAIGKMPVWTEAL